MKNLEQIKDEVAKENPNISSYNMIDKVAKRYAEENLKYILVDFLSFSAPHLATLKTFGTIVDEYLKIRQFKNELK